MSVPNILRRPALWLAVPALALVVVYDRNFPATDFMTGNWAAVAGQSVIFLLFATGAASVGAALEGSRARRGHLYSQPISRSRFGVLVSQLWLPLAVGLVTQAVAIALLARHAFGSPGEMPCILIVQDVAVIVMHLAVGYVLGRSLPIAVAIPGALLVSYCWLGFTGAIGFDPIRYLGGLASAQCCTVDTQLDVRGPIATIVFSLLATALLALYGTRFARVGRVRAAGTGSALGVSLVVSGVIGVLIAANVGPVPIHARPVSQTQCSGSAPKVCLFPEQSANAATQPTLVRATANLRLSGVPVPSVIYGAQGNSDTNEFHVYVSPNMAPPQIIHTLVSGYFPTTIVKFCGDGSDYNDRLAVAGAMSAWLAQRAGVGIVPSASVAPLVPDGDALYSKVVKLSTRRQLAWFNEARRMQEQCSIDPKVAIKV